MARPRASVQCHPERPYHAKELEYARTHRDKMRAYSNRWQRKNKDRTCDYQRKKKYGITAAQFQDLLASQNYECAICEHPINRRAHVDHDHNTGKIRGLLCPQCNQMLGMARDSLGVLQSAIEYIIKHSES